MPVSGKVKLDAKDIVIEYYTPRTGRIGYCCALAGSAAANIAAHSNTSDE